MSKPTYEVLNLVGSGDITIEKAARQLGVAEKNVKQMMTVWGDRLDVLTSMMNLVNRSFRSRTARSNAKKGTAGALGITIRQVNRLMKKQGIETKRPESMLNREENARIAAEKWQLRQKNALSVIAGTDDMENAAIAAEICTRQMYRWVTKLLAEEGLVIKDLKAMDFGARAKLATRIEKNHRA
jgi:hypothetical protein